jgi:hypothetical protein
VEVLESKVSPQLGLLSRRVLVRHVVPDSQNRSDETVQGWASIQSWQGYVILSPISSLCYTNTRWGPTRPIIRQCGHAAHFHCVEAHCLSLHQRSAGNQPFDGRFSANIDEGEFLCPLCKQLSNILIPEDKPVEAIDQVLPTSPSSTMREDKEGFEILKNNMISSHADMTLIRNILERTSTVSYSEALSKREKATLQFGSSLSQAMQLSSDNGGAQRRRERELHPALRRWDFEDDDQGEGPLLQKNPQIGSILRLMRQLLISWAAVGHSAAASETSARGSRQVVFGEVTYTSTDPWSDYTSSGRDTHPMLLELRRTMAATASLFDAVTFELGKQLGSKEEKAKSESVSIFGSLICDILEGQHWMVKRSKDPSSDEWRVVTSIIATMLCHVSKGDTIAQRLEARAVATSMWTILGSSEAVSSGSSVSMNLDSSPEVEVNEDGHIGNQDASRLFDDSVRNEGYSPQPRPVLPPKPLSIYRTERNLAIELGPKWGTLDPFKVKANNLHQIPFRPAVASAFLYVPLLAWDLSILAGAVFSSLMSNSNSSPSVSCCELLQSARVLLVGRLIQVLSTPYGFLTSRNTRDEHDDFDDDQHWDDVKKRKEATAIKDLLLFCRGNLPGAIEPDGQVLDEASLLQNVGNAILPFGRTLILLLRASSSALRQRHRRIAKAGIFEETQVDKVVAQISEDPNTMTIEDGFWLLDIIGAPLPSSILHSSWNSLAKRWLTSLKGFEAYHGTRGKGLIFDENTRTWASVANENSLRCTPSLQNLRVETSSAAVEVAQLLPQGDDSIGDKSDSDVDLGEESEDLSSSGSLEDEVMEFVDEALAADSDEEHDEALAADSEVDMDVELDDHPGIYDFFDVDDASDVNATLNEVDGSKIPGPIDHVFAYVSRSAIIPYQSSILGISQVGPGPRGARGELFEYNVANSVMRDMSHLGSVHLPGMTIMCFSLDSFVRQVSCHRLQPFRCTSELFGDASKIICRVV